MTGFELHPLEQVVRTALVRCARIGEAVYVLQTAGEPVALALELLEAEQARAGKPVVFAHARGTGGDVWEGARDELGKLALEPCDLRAQRDARGALVDPLDSRCIALNRQLLGLAHDPTPPHSVGKQDSTSARTRRAPLAAPSRARLDGEDHTR